MKKRAYPIITFSILMLLILVLTSGCAFRLKNPNRVEQADKAQQASTDITTAVENLRSQQKANLDQVLKAEQESVAADISLDQEATLKAFLVEDAKPLGEIWLNGQYATRKLELGIGEIDLSELSIDLQIRDQRLKDFFNTRDTISQDSIPELAKVKCINGALDPNPDKALEASLERLKAEAEGQGDFDERELKKILKKQVVNLADNCKEINKVKGFVSLDSDCTNAGSWCSAKKESDFAKSQIKSITTHKKSINKQLKQLAKQLAQKDEQKKPSELIKILNEDLQTHAKDLSGLLAIIGKDELVAKRIQAIDCILSGENLEEKNTNCNDVSDGQKNVAAAIAGWVEVADHFDAVVKAGEASANTDLLILKGGLVARREANAAALGRIRAEYLLRQQLFELYSAEVQTYVTVDRLWARANKEAKRAELEPAFLESQKLDGLLLATPGSGMDAKQKAAFKRMKFAATKAITLQVYAESRSRKGRFDTEYKIIDLAYQAQIDETIATIQERLALIQPLISQQSAYYNAPTIEAKDLANLTRDVLAIFGLAAIVKD